MLGVIEKQIKMTQEKADEIFSTSIGRQLDAIYVTSDDLVFIRYEEAVDNAAPDGKVSEWLPSWELQIPDPLDVDLVRRNVDLLVNAEKKRNWARENKERVATSNKRWYDKFGREYHRNYERKTTK